MKRTIVIGITIIAVLLAGISRAGAEFVFLRDGRIIEGKILNETPAAVTVKKSDGSVTVFARGAVLRILFTRVYMGKVYINKTDGKVLEAYIVDEDQEAYTVRTDITSPKEIVIRREDVLFMARKNPTGLNGRVSQKHVDLAWKPPYNPVKKYKIYVSPRGGQYREAGTSLGTRFRVTGLNCNMEYLARVTAVDRDNYESLPSNEIRIVTEKGRPVPPGGVRIAKMASDRDRVYTAHLAWERAEDPCGGVISDYNVYLKTFDVPGKDGGSKEAVPAGKVKIPSGYRLVGRTSESVFQIKGLRDSTQYGVIVTSVDNTKDESDSGAEIAFNTGVSRPAYPYPVTCKKELSKDAKELSAIITWGEVKDEFRRIAGYRVYRREGGGFRAIGATERTDFAVKNLSPAKKETFTVRSIDVRGMESEDSYPVSTGLLRYTVFTARSGCVVPLRDFGRLYKPGYGVALYVGVDNLFLDGLGLGIETGYSYLEGKTGKSTFTAMVPFMGKISYRIQLTRWFSLDPSIAMGGSWNRADRSVFMEGLVESLLFQRYRTRSQVEPMFAAGLDCTFIIKKFLLLRAGARYGGIIENKGLMDFISLTGAIGFRF
ncbi:MAG: fibronectin type III domain-containing protein [Spirochaetes bacterium]|nr:fibronectin type III domain-containing protein [Spirochaetota bacterium]